jgi:hypothetical protein
VKGLYALRDEKSNNVWPMPIKVYDQVPDVRHPQWVTLRTIV